MIRFIDIPKHTIFLVAPSGSGKTELARESIVLDADRLPSMRAAYQALLEEFGLEWFKRKEVDSRLAEALHAAMTATFRSSALGFVRPEAMDVDKPIATVELSAVALLVQQDRVPAGRVSVWVPTPETLTSQQMLRRTQLPWAQPIFSVEHNRVICKWFRDVAEKLKLHTILE